MCPLPSRKRCGDSVMNADLRPFSPPRGECARCPFPRLSAGLKPCTRLCVFQHRHLRAARSTRVRRSNAAGKCTSNGRERSSTCQLLTHEVLEFSEFASAFLSTGPVLGGSTQGPHPLTRGPCQPLLMGASESKTLASPGPRSLSIQSRHPSPPRRQLRG